MHRGARQLVTGKMVADGFLGLCDVVAHPRPAERAGDAAFSMFSTLPPPLVPAAFLAYLRAVGAQPAVSSRPRAVGPRTVVLIPAHNEEEQIAATLESTINQTRAADVVVVAADNCTDRTVEIARSYPGVEVFETVENPHRKAGALNQAWHRYARDADVVVTMDADTGLDGRFVESALEELEADGELAGVCGRFSVKDGQGLLWRLQRLEFARAADNKDLTRDRVSVLAGAGVAYRGEALRQLVTSTGRDDRGPWEPTSLVEDYTLTLDLKQHGWQVRSGRRMYAHTDTPATLPDLWKQRNRWQRGTVDELRRRGWSPEARRDLLLHVAVVGMIAVRVLFILMLALSIGLGTGLTFHPIWLVPIGLAVADRAHALSRMRDRTWKDVIMGVSLLPEELYGVFHHANFIRSAWLSYRRAGATW